MSSIKKSFIYIGIFASVLCLTSCSADPKPDDSNNVRGLSTKNDMHYEPIVNDDNQVTGQKSVLDSVVSISPTYAQAVYYAKKSGMGGQYTLGIIVLIVGLGGGLFLAISGKVKQLTFPCILMALGLVGCGAFFVGKPYWVWLNNKKEIPVAQYDATMAAEGNTQAIWDNFYDQNLLIGANSK